MSMDIIDTNALDQADMKRLATGHDAALNDLMERHAAGVFRLLYRMLNNEDDANDLAQETFVRVFQARASFDANKKFSTWLFTIAANLTRNQIRWRTRHPNVSLEAETDATNQPLAEKLASTALTPKEQVLSGERAAAVRAAVNDLAEDMREAIVLCEWEEHSMVKAAAILETTPKAIESRLYRARQILRERLKDWLH
jgi:RNA polymerase sigma-70 factor (ECF subfamily)